MTSMSGWRPNRGLLVSLALWLPVFGIISLLVSYTPVYASLPSDFEDTLVARISGGPTELVWTPDGRILVANKRGQVRVIQNGELLSTPAINLEPIMCTNGERALGGIALHPNFETNGFIYLYYTFNKFGTCNESEVDGPVNRLSRFVMSGNTIDPGSELVLMDTPPLFRDHHNAGDIHFGKDGYLYAAVGDGGTARFNWPQDPGRLFGKIVRITDSGEIPADNPFTGPGTARCNVDGMIPAGSPDGTMCQEIYALGLRNPWRIAFDPNADGVRFFINDVGQHSWEEINESALGANYGWPEREGACLKDSTTNCPPPPPGMTDPVYAYGHGPDGGAVTGGAFVPNGVWPSAYDGMYLFADYVFGEMYRLVPDSSNSFGFTHELFTTVPRVVSMRFGPDGQLYYTSREDGHIRKIAYVGDANRSPVARIVADPTYGAVPLTVTFDGSTSSDPDGDALSYSWDFEDDGTVDSTDVVTQHTYTVEGIFQARLTVDDGNGGVNSTTIRIDAGNEPPVPVIESPVEGNLYAVGDQFVLVGSAIDPEDGALPDDALVWEVERHHADHTHPFFDATPGNNIPFTFPEPEDFHAAGTSFLRVYLTATDSTGLSATVSRDLNPKFVDVTFLTEPPGLMLIVNESPIITPLTEASWEAYELRVNAPDQIAANGDGWVFDSWSTGGERSHTIVTPAEPATFIATFVPGDVASSHVFTSIADSQVRSAEPDRNFGTSSSLRTDADPIINSYIKFNVENVNGPVSSAKLRVYATSSNSVGYDVRGVQDTTWQESTLTYNNAPPMGSIVGSSGPTTVDTWTEVDVTSLVTGNGVLSVGMTSTSSNAANFASKERDGGTLAPQLVVQIGTGADTSPPTVPSGVSATATASTQVNVSWQPSSDNVGVAGYTVYRDGAEIATVDGATLSYDDLSVVPSTAYSYSVDAFDAAGNRSAQSDPVQVVTPSAGGAASRTFGAIADAQVREDNPTRNYGSSSSLRTDAEPIITSYMKFDITGIEPPVNAARLRLYATSNNTIGVRAFLVTDSGWTELGINYDNAPPFVGDELGASGRVFADSWAEVDVTSAITGNGLLTIGIDSLSKTATNFASREMDGGNLTPHLVVEYGGEGGSDDDTTPPSVPTGLAAIALSPTAVELSWNAATDDVGVAGYTLYRDGAELHTVDGSTLSFTDETVQPGTAYSYTIDAFDAAGNRSDQSGAVPVQTPDSDGSGSITALPIADAQVREDNPDRNYGTSSSLRTDAEPVINSYLKFDLQGITAPVTRAVIQIYPTSTNNVGYRIHGVPDTSWDERGITFDNAPLIESAHVGASGPTTAGVWSEVDITALIQGNGFVSLAMTSTSKTAANFSSKEQDGGSLAPKIIVEFGGSGEDTSPPSIPAGLIANPISANEVALTWQAATDNVGVVGYTIYRDDVELITVDGSTLEILDSGLIAQTSYSYTVDAFDAAGNRSAQSDPAIAVTPSEDGSALHVFTPIADAQVREDDPDRNFGNSPSIRTDAVPIINSYLTFDVSGIAGTITSAKIRIFATSANTVGYQLHGVSDTSWQETALTWNNAPEIDGGMLGASGPVTAGTWTEVDITTSVYGDGVIGFAMTSTSPTATNFGSRESGATSPQLIIETGP